MYFAIIKRSPQGGLDGQGCFYLHEMPKYILLANVFYANFLHSFYTTVQLIILTLLAFSDYTYYFIATLQIKINCEKLQKQVTS